MQQVLSVNQISKTYKKNAQDRIRNFRQDILYRFSHLFNRDKNHSQEHITALSNIHFELEKGDVLGIIGRNGAGKSTLLKIMAGIVQPTSGHIIYEGKLVSILEIGTGFHPDLTGEENVYLNGSLLGMSKEELKNKFNAIVAFSELEDFIREPVKNYSNGMYLRLAFSVFSHLKSDILLLDEVISVGDFPFRQKCYHQIHQLAKSGITIVMVSHYPDQIKDLCNKCLWLENGSMKAFGTVDKVLENYLEKHIMDVQGLTGNASLSIKNYYLHWSEGFVIKNEINLLRYGLKAKNKSSSDPVLMADEIIVELEFEKLNGNHSIEITISIRSMYEAWVLVDSFGLFSKFENEVHHKGRYYCSCLIPGGLLNFGVYQLGLLVSQSETLIYQNPYLLNFTIQFQELDGVKNHLAKEAKSILKPFGNWQVLRLEDTILDGSIDVNKIRTSV